MEGSVGLGLMAAFAVSGSVVLIVHGLHKRLLSDFMKQIEFELGGSKKCQTKMKRVRFAEDVMTPSSDNKEYRKRHLLRMSKGGQAMKMEEEDVVVVNNHHEGGHGAEMLETMPLNRQILYKGIIQYKSGLKDCKMSTCF